MTSAVPAAPVAAATPTTSLRERRLDLAARAAVVVVFPLATIGLARSMGYYERLPPIPIGFLYGTPFAWQTVLFGGLALACALVAVLVRTRGPQLALALAAGILFWLGFPYSRLAWHRLFPDAPRFAQMGNPGIVEWLLGATLLLVAGAFALADGAERAREAYLAKGATREEADAARASIARSAGRTLLAGVALAALVALGYWALAGGASALFVALPRVNPVLALLAIGIGLALLLAAVVRGRSVTTGELEPLVAARAPPPPPRRPGTWQDGMPHPFKPGDANLSAEERAAREWAAREMDAIRRRMNRP